MRLGLGNARWAVEGWLVRATGRIVVGFGLMIVMALVVGTLWWLVSWASSERETEKVVDRWAEMGRSFESFAERFPARVANESARRLEKLVRPLGVDLVPKGIEDRGRPDDGAVTAFNSVKGPLGKFADLVSRSDHRVTKPIDTEALAFFDRHSEVLTGVVEHLLVENTPEWEQDISQAYKAPLPNLLGQIHLARLLVVWSIALESDGRTDDAHRSLDAAWAFYLALRQRPEIISNFIGFAEYQFIAGAARNQLNPPAHWPELLMSPDLQKAYLDSIQFEAWIAMEAVRLEQLLGGGGSGGRLFLPVTQNGLAVYAELLRTAFDTLPSRSFADFDAGEGFSMAFESLPPNSIVAKIALTDVWAGWARMGRAALCGELSANAIRLRRTLADKGGDESFSATTEMPSVVFPSVSWQFDRQPDGVSIHPNQQLPVLPPTPKKSLCSSWFEEVAHDG